MLLTAVVRQYIPEDIMDKITKVFEFKVNKFHEDEDEKSHIGTVEGHISTFGNIDRDGDTFARTAFDRTLEDLKTLNKIFLPMLWQHKIDTPIGGFPIREMRTDNKGLFVIGEINLETQGGHEAFALAKQGVISEFSIGFIPKESRLDGEIRIFEDIDLIEASLVTIPANPQAMITNVKSIVPFQDIPIARHDGELNTSHRWDASAAIKRIDDLIKSSDQSLRRKRNAFLWVNDNDNDNDKYEIPIADVIDGKLSVIPRAIFTAAATLQAARGVDNIPDSDRPAVIINIERYYNKMGLESPFKIGFGINEIKSSPIKIVKKMLQQGTNFTKAGADMIAGLEAGRRKSAVSNDRDSSGIHNLESKMKEFKELNHVSRHKRTQRSDERSDHHTA